ncbi:MAG: amino acid-binding protein [Frankiales bacterium]|nr:amino acid-binding protein [Frankiales bacterium]
MLLADSAGGASHGWIWAVLGGLALASVLLWHIANAMLSALPEEVRAPVKASVRSNSRPLAVMAVVVLWTLTYALYSVAHLPSTTAPLAAEQTPSGTITTPGSPAAGSPTGSVAKPGLPVLPGSTVVGGATPARPSSSSSGGGAANPTVFGPQAAGPTAGSASFHDSSLFHGAANVRGITAKAIKVCGHAPLTLGYAINTKPEDELVFWKYLNAHGGVFGRQFDVTLEDDQYTATGGVPAAAKCKAKNPFMIFGALGSDVIPPVRQWAEQNKELYLYGFTVRSGSQKFKYSFTNTISSEDLSRVIADLAVDRFRGQKVGIIWRNSNNFQPARDAYVKEIVKREGGSVVDVPVAQNQGSYSQEILTLQQAGAKVVYVLEDAFTQLAILRQGKSQQYNPNWQVFGFNVQTKGLGRDALTPPLTGSNLAPPYECHQYGGPYASYGAEIKVFEAAYAAYSPSTDLCGIAGDVAWDSWVEFKNMAGLFAACGRDCTRDRFAGLMESGYHGVTGAACPVDFRGDGHHGGFYADLFEAYATGANTAGWRPIRRCVGAF